jgi:hypothetical protein
LSEAGKDEAVTGAQSRSACGALQHTQLVAQHQDLELTISMPPGDEQNQEQAEDGVGDRKQHGSLPSFSESEMVSDSAPPRDSA